MKSRKSPRTSITGRVAPSEEGRLIRKKSQANHNSSLTKPAQEKLKWDIELSNLERKVLNVLPTRQQEVFYLYRMYCFDLARSWIKDMPKAYSQLLSVPSEKIKNQAMKNISIELKIAIERLKE